jgi:hypothetical protein
MSRRDLLSECIQPGLPVQTLTEAWCSRCSNPECSRSTVGSSRFDTRVKDWEKKLFLEPPKMTPDDPLFAAIAAKRFITIDPGRTPEIRSDWVDPRDLQEPEPVAAPTRPVTVPPPSGSGGPPPSAAPAQAAAQPPKPASPTPNPQNPTASPQSALAPSATSSLIGQNAPDQSGKILRGGPSAPTTKSDPWAAPDPPDPADVVVQPGAKIKMGRSGV